ncbi:MAG: DsbA family protein [Pseudomonadales bacterium]
MSKVKIVGAIALVAGLFFIIATYVWTQNKPVDSTVIDSAQLQPTQSVSMGPEDAKVTIVEFFDPACEACRAFYPFVKQLMADNPQDVRLVLRYAAFHQGSEEVVRMLEAARIQKVFKPVLEALLETQPKWASHGSPQLSIAWQAAKEAGLDTNLANLSLRSDLVNKVVERDAADVKALGVQKTPTFYVNGRSLPSFGAQQLKDLVEQELKK